MAKHKLIITDGLAPDAVEILENSDLFEINLQKGISKDDLMKIVGEYDAAVIRSATKFTADLFDAGGNLKAIMRAGSGVDNIDVPHASSKGIYVFNTPGANNNAVAELAIGYALALLRFIPQATSGMKNGKWEKKELTGFEVQGRTLGIAGLGAIGCLVAEKAKGLGMEVIAYDPSNDAGSRSACVSSMVGSMDELFEKSSMISLHVPLIDATRNSIGKAQFDKMQNGSYLINCARGGIVNEADLLAALESGKLAGAALDVFEKEPVPTGDKLVAHENVICTPHIGAATKESQQKVGQKAAYGLIKFFKENHKEAALNFKDVK